MIPNTPDKEKPPQNEPPQKPQNNPLKTPEPKTDPEVNDNTTPP